MRFLNSLVVLIVEADNSFPSDIAVLPLIIALWQMDVKVDVHQAAQQLQPLQPSLPQRLPRHQVNL